MNEPLSESLQHSASRIICQQHEMFQEMDVGELGERWMSHGGGLLFATFRVHLG